MHEVPSKVNSRQMDPHPHWTGFSPDGKFALVPDLGTDNIHIYKVDLDGSSLTPHSLAPSVPGGGPRHMRFSTNGKFVYSANWGHDSITAFKTESTTGKLTEIETEPIHGSWPRNARIDPTGKWLFVSGEASNTVSIFSINQETGELTFPTKNLVNLPSVYCILFKE